MRSKFKWIFALLIALTMQFSFAQEKTVTGTVADGNGMPLVGANVKNGSQGVSTNADGKFAIKAKPGDELAITYTGMAKRMITVGPSNNYNVKMSSEAETLGPVMITGAVGIKKKKDNITNAFTVISAKEIGAAVNPNTVRGLAGKVAGLSILNNSNGVNGSTSIQIRSNPTFSGNGAALVVIDEVISTATVFANMPPTMIESVNIIKGAQGAVLYGELGANGVVVVTTKRAVKGDKVTVDFNSSIDFERVSFVPEKQTKYGQGWGGVRDHYENGGWGELMDGSIVDVGLPQADGNSIMAPYSPVKDNIKQFYKTGTIIQNGVGIRLGGEKGYVNFNADNQLREFIVKGDAYRRSSFLFKAGTAGERWSVDGQFNYRVGSTKQSDATSTLQTLQQSASSIPIGMFDNGNPQGGWTVYYNNPFWLRDNNRIVNTDNFYNTAISLGFKASKNIKLKYNGSMRFSNSNQIKYGNGFVETIPQGVGSLGQVSSFYQSNLTSRSYYGDVMAMFNYELTKDLDFNATIGHNMIMNNDNRISQGGQNLELDGWYHISNVQNPAIPALLQNSRVDENKTGEFADLAFSYKDYLTLNLTGRYDHTSKLLPSNRDYFYPSAGIAFVPTKLTDLNSAKINYLKLFANWTRNGSTAAIGNYATINRISIVNGFPFNGSNSFNDNYYPVNPNIKPEFYTTNEAGFTLGMFNDRITLDAAAYITNAKNVISNLSTSAASGNIEVLDNVGDVRTKGLELSLNFVPVKTKTINWNGTLNFSTYANEVLALRGGQSQVTMYNVGDAQFSSINGSIVAQVGQPFPYLIGTDWLRDNNGNVIVNSTTGMPTANPTQQGIGKVNPDYTLGFTNNFSYKGFGLVFTVDYKKGGKIFSESLYNMTWAGHTVESADHDRDAGFIYPGSVINTGTIANPVYTQNTSVATAAGYGANGNEAYYQSLANLGTYTALDATVLKVREIALSYTLNAATAKQMGLTTVRFGVNARNPFIILAKDNRGYTDPDATNLYDSSISGGAQRVTTAANTSAAGRGFAEVSQYPSTRTIGFSLNVGF